MNKKNKIKAHDILSNDDFVIDSLSDKTGNKEELKIAAIINNYLSSKRNTIPNSEKEETKRRIKLSVQKAQRNKYLSRWAVAASILLVIISAWFLQNDFKKETGIVDFAQSLDFAKPDSVTNLLLQDGRKVLITEKDSRIEYDPKGENIIIDSTQKISQKVVQVEQVFNTLVVPYGKQTQITLSDGSIVWLNSGSKLVYPANMKEKRKVYIEGEAVFDVTHSEQHPFFVATKDFEIKVLGTVFNVSAYTDDNVSSAVLERGKIELDLREKSLFHKKRLTILPGTMAVFDSNDKTFHQQQVDAKNYLSWRDGYFIFKNEPLANIIKKLERYYNVEIVLEDETLGRERFSGNLNLKNTPEEVLNVIAETTPFIVRYDNQKLIINLN
ncbi:DUF4974 domain-containing protein [Maribellus comscasis]|uniref:DUF4974 domain-containing protein n=1 Tax=Maribellus comscasis TaxID=2681766 RepID=A0A6I6JRD4_9BACT|nr:FecR domain-containing protein [Maribellus comscasis]QGY42543.1 DUF4974 domain-containing protein [Maribellus comscasis]